LKSDNFTREPSWLKAVKSGALEPSFGQAGPAAGFAAAAGFVLAARTVAFFVAAGLFAADFLAAVFLAAVFFAVFFLAMAIRLQGGERDL
jgi:fatty acid desaturase